MTTETKLFIGIFGFTVLIIFGAMLLFSRPEKPYSKEQLVSADSITKGNPDAPHFLVEFSDYQCPACKGFQPVVEDILTAYGTKLLFVYRHYPLPQHPISKQASLAALAAEIQGKYWDMHSYLFEHQTSLSDSIINKGAESLSLNMDQFLSDMKESSLSARIEQDISAGNSLGVNATPTFYLNGKKLTLNSYEDLKKAVEKVIASQ